MTNRSYDFEWNLSPSRSQAEEKKIKQFCLLLCKSLLILLITLVLVHYLFSLLSVSQHKQIIALKDQLNVTHSIADLKNHKQDAFLRLLNRNKLIKQLNSLRQPSVNMLALLPKVLVNGICLDSIRLQNNQVFIKAKAENTEQMGRLFQNIKNTPEFNMAKLMQLKPDFVSKHYPLSFQVNFSLGVM